MIFFQLIIQTHLNTYHIYKHVLECLLQKTMMAAVQATDEQLIATECAFLSTQKFELGQYAEK